jgi:Flp pilus assembly protein TadD
MKAPVAIVVAFLVAVSAATAEAQAGVTARHHQALKHYRAGQELLRAEQFEKAAREFSAAVELDPLLALAHYGLGQSYVGVKRYASAIQAFIGCREAYRKIISLRDEHRAEMENRIDDEIRELQSMAARIRGGQYKGVGESRITEIDARIDDLRRMRQEPMTQFHPPAEVSLALGSAYFRNGDRDRAESEWKAAIEVNPRLGEAHNNLAVVYMMTGRLELAEQEIKAAENAGYRVNPQLKRDLKSRKTSSQR